MQETLYINNLNVLRVTWAVEPPQGSIIMDATATRLDGDCTAWTGEVEARRCNGDLIIQMPHDCDSATDWNSDLGEYRMVFSFLGTDYAAITVKLNMRKK